MRAYDGVYVVTVVLRYHFASGDVGRRGGGRGGHTGAIIENDGGGGGAGYAHVASAGTRAFGANNLSDEPFARYR